jgi:hypothetical protein
MKGFVLAYNWRIKTGTDYPIGKGDLNWNAG